MLKIRLSRQGRSHNKFYRVVTIDKNSKRSGEALDTVGFWQPAKNMLSLDKKKIDKWLAKGAKLTKAVSNLIKLK